MSNFILDGGGRFVYTCPGCGESLAFWPERLIEEPPLIAPCNCPKNTKLTLHLMSMRHEDAPTAAEIYYDREEDPC